eukprot:s7633_g1.t1
MTLQPVPTELCSQLDEEEACSAGEVKEAVVAETAEPGLGANCPVGDWVPFVPDVLLQGFDSCVFDGEIGPFGVCRIGAVDGRGRGGGACSDSMLGAGSFSYVFSCSVHGVEESVAVKVLRSKDVLPGRGRESEFIQGLRHPNLVNVLGIFEDQLPGS